MRLRLAPSILTADFARLGDEVASVAPYVDWLHLDVMDGHYVDNLTFGPSVVEAVHRSCDLPLHVHLMITRPLEFVGAFASAGARRISFHPEVVPDAAEVIGAIGAAGCGAGIAVHPDSTLDFAAKHLLDVEVVLMMTVKPGFGGQAFLERVLPKIGEARRMLHEAGASADLEVDGGINSSTLEAAVRAGGDVLVAGSAIFDGVDPAGAARALRQRLDELSLL